MYSGGTLKIASGETADSLTVRAAFKVDTSKFGEVKITLKKLSKKKKYYIRWRPYKKYKGKKYLGVLKGVKKV